MNLDLFTPNQLFTILPKNSDIGENHATDESIYSSEKLNIVGFDIIIRPNIKCRMIEISSKKYTRSAKSVVYLGGVRQYFINRILSDIYIQIKIKSPAQYKIGIARL